MDHAAVVPGLVDGGPGLGLDHEDVEVAEPASETTGGGKADDPGPDANDVGALRHGGVQELAGAVDPVPGPASAGSPPPSPPGGPGTSARG